MGNKDNFLILILVALLVIVLCKRRVEGFANNYTDALKKSMNAVQALGMQVINQAAEAGGKVRDDNYNKNIYGYISFEHDGIYKNQIKKKLGIEKGNFYTNNMDKYKFHANIKDGKKVYPIPISNNKDFKQLDSILVDFINFDGDFEYVKDKPAERKQIYLKPLLWLKDPRLKDGNENPINRLCIRTADKEDGRTLITFDDTKNFIDYVGDAKIKEDNHPDIFAGMVGYKLKTFKNGDKQEPEKLLSIRPITRYEKEKFKLDDDGNPVAICQFPQEILDKLKKNNKERIIDELEKDARVEKTELTEEHKDKELKIKQDDIQARSCTQLRCYGFTQKIPNDDNEDVCDGFDHPGVSYEKCEN